MSDIKKIINFLRLHRRLEENKDTPIKEISLDILITGESIKVPIAQFENFEDYIRLVSYLEMYKPDVIYDFNDTVYIKKDNRFYDIFSRQFNDKIKESMVNDVEIKIGFDYKYYFYDVKEKHVLLGYTDIEEVKVFPDTIPYNPQEEPVVDFDSKYTYKYDDETSTSYSILRTFSQNNEIGNPTAKFVSDRYVELTKDKEKGKMYLFPSLYFSSKNDHYFLNYEYWKPKTEQTEKIKKIIPYYIIPNDNVAVSLEFYSKGAFLMFLNETIFSQANYDFSEIYKGEKRNQFKEQFTELIIDPLEKSILDPRTSYDDIMVTLYYLHESVAITLSSNFIWFILEWAINRDDLTNFSYKEEDIFIKLLRIILQKEGQEIKVMEWLCETLNKKGKTITKFEFLYDRLNNENFLQFCNLINKAWRKSRFVDLSTETNPEYKSTNGPVLLPYQSEKIASFFFSNLSASFQDNPKNNKERIMLLNFDTGKTHEVPAANATGQKTEEIVNHYYYHPFYPVKIKDTDKESSEQETAIKLDMIVPAFMLMANENEQFWNNIKKAGEYTLDAVAIATSYGTLSGLAVGEVISTLAIARGIGATAAITSSVANIILKLANAQDSVLGKEFIEYLFWIEMLSLSGEITLAIRNGLKRSAAKLVEKEEDLAKLEKKLDEAVIEENGQTRKLIQEEKEEILDEIEEAAELTENTGGTRKKRKARGNPEDQLSSIGRNIPPLTPEEIHRVLKWQNFRNTFLKKWKDLDFSNNIQDLESKLEKARNSIRKNLTPDDLAAVIKEKRGERILDADGIPYDHLWENKQARISIINATKSLKSQMSKNPSKHTEYEDLLKDLSKLKDEVSKTTK